MGGVYPDRTPILADRLDDIACLGAGGAYFDGCSVEPELSVIDGSVAWRVGG